MIPDILYEEAAPSNRVFTRVEMCVIVTTDNNEHASPGGICPHAPSVRLFIQINFRGGKGHTWVWLRFAGRNCRYRNR